MGRFKASKYGLIALSLNIAEAAFVLVSLAIVRELGLWGRAPHWLEQAFSAAFLGGGPH